MVKCQGIMLVGECLYITKYGGIEGTEVTMTQLNPCDEFPTGDKTIVGNATSVKGASNPTVPHTSPVNVPKYLGRR